MSTDFSEVPNVVKNTSMPEECVGNAAHVPKISSENVNEVERDTHGDITEFTSEQCSTEISATASNVSSEAKETCQTSCNELEQNVVGETNSTTNEEEWVDLLGSGDLKKRVIKPGIGPDSRPERGDWIVADIICRNSSGEVVDTNVNFELRLGDMDVVTGLDMAISLMQQGEQAEILVPSRLAYGNFGRYPDIAPNEDVSFEVTLHSALRQDDEKLTVSERLRLGNEKRSRGNFWYTSDNVVNAIICYQKACQYLDGIEDGSENSPEMLQTVLDTRVAVNNNLAAAHLKVEGYDAALKSLDFVLKMQPKNVKAHFRKGKIFAARGMIAESISEMKIAAKLEPDSKSIQQELKNLCLKKKIEDDNQKAMYKRMLGLNKEKSNLPKSSSWGKWSVMVCSALIVAVGMVAFRQYHSG